ncbi:MAG TPA: hypothetical protein VF698_05335, partial [Thermoanaerobaculia bacterium]
AAAHTPGVNGTMWMSDVAIQNFQQSALTIELVLVESGFANTNNVFPLTSATIPANGSVLLKDVLNAYRGTTAITGAILIGADRPFAVTSRTYSMAPSGDTVGQTVMPARDFIENTTRPTNLTTAVAYIPGLINNSRFRTNLGFVAGNASSTDALALTITLRDAAGAMVGNQRFIAIPAGGFVHTQFSASDRTFDIGSAEFRISQGSGAVVPYASVIDNVTADAVFVPGVFPASPAPAGNGGAMMPSVFRDLFDAVKLPQ